VFSSLLRYLFHETSTMCAIKQEGFMS
jgi:hypothetical protein